MAASGGSSHDESIYKGSVEDFEISCEPCKNDGNVVEASGYCQNCDEYLCTTCMKTHCRLKPCKHHVVLDKHQMSQSKPRQLKFTLDTVTCDKHPCESLKFFCKKHGVTGCGDCIFLDHRTCDVDYISTLADGYNTSTEYTSIIQKVEQLQTEVNAIPIDAAQTAAKAEATIGKAIADIKQYRRDVDAYFAKAECIIMAKCEKIQTLNHIKLTKTSDAIKSLGNELTSVHASLTSNIENTENLFVRAQELRWTLETLENEMQVNKKTQFQCVEFAKNVNLTSDKLTETSLGALQESGLPIYTRAQHISIQDRIIQHNDDVRLVDSNDGLRCYITGIVHLHGNIFVCTDNKSVKLVDIHQQIVLYSVSVIDGPWDITSISPDTVAVTIPFQSKIQFFEVKNDMILHSNDINVTGECRGIDCIQDKVVVCYGHPSKVEILDFHGNVLKLIQTDNIGTDLFNGPQYVVFSRDGGSIYVFGNGIIKLTIYGTVQASYKGSDLTTCMPSGVFVCRDGSVLLCSGNSIVAMSDDLERWKIFNNGDESYYLTLCCDEDNGRLFCSISNTRNTFRVFTIG